MAKVKDKRLERGDLVAQVARRLREAIMTGALAPGDRIVEAQLARELDISRAPIREAARSLESEGLVTSIPARGFFVREITVRELEEVFEFRVCVECFAAVEAAKLKSKDLHNELVSGLDRMLTAARRQNHMEQVRADFAFHRSIVASTNNRRLLRSFSDATNDMTVAIGLIGYLGTDWGGLAESHRPLIEVIESGDADRARLEMAAHIRLSWDETLARLRRRVDIPLSRLTA